MGEVIRKDAAVSDILSDVRTTLSRSQQQPDTAFFAAAEEHLAPVLGLIGGVETKLAEARSVAEPLVHALEVADRNADSVLGLQADIVWNAIGRPKADPTYALLYPEGVAGYTDVDVLDQPVRMEVLVDLLRARVHPKLPADVAEKAATEIATAMSALDAAVENVRKPRARVKMLEKSLTALARIAAIELGRMKRALLAKGLSEAQVHEVIPDRPQSKAKKKAPEPASA